MGNLLKAKDINSSRDSFELKDVNIIIPEGSIILLGGRNGAGKTTILETLTCSIKPSKGKIVVKDELIFNDGINKRKKREALKDIGVHYQDDELFDQLTIRETFDTFFSLYPDKPKTDLINECPFIKGKLEKKIGELSKGRKQLIKILLSVSHNPDLVFMDEPYSNLDEETLEWFIGILKELKKSGVSFFIAVNELGDIGELADELYVVDDGTIKQHFKNFNKFFNGTVLIIDKETPYIDLNGPLNVTQVSKKNNEKIIFVDDDRSELFSKIDKIDIEIKSIRRPKLNDFFQEIKNE